MRAFSIIDSVLSTPMEQKIASFSSTAQYFWLFIRFFNEDVGEEDEIDF